MAEIPMSLEDGEKESSSGRQTEATMLDLFVSGYDEMTFEPDDLNPDKYVINARMSYRPADGEELSSTVNLLYVPDPPCILPFDEEDLKETQIDQTQPEIQEYWKKFAGFLEYWPQIRVIRENMRKFRVLWSNRPVGSRLRGFVCVSNNPVGERFKPSMDEDQKNGQVIRSGQCVGIEAMSENDANVRFLKLPGPGAGWVFENKDDMQVMCEMKSIEPGLWWYRVVAQTPQELRKCPVLSEASRNGWILAPKEVTMVDLRCRVGGYNFFHLMDGRGWMFELKPGTMKNDKSLANIVFSQCDDDFVDGGEIAALRSLVPPTNEVVEVGMWTYVVNIEPVMAIGTKKNGYFLRPGDVVRVDKRANSNGNPAKVGGPGIQNRRWLRLGGNQGWVPETDGRGRKLMLEQMTDEVCYPSWFKPSVDVNKPVETWHLGVV